MSAKLSSPIPAPRRPAASPGASFGARTVERAQGRSEVIELALFWAFVAGLAWVPYWYGSNDYFAWGVNAVLFCGLAAIYEVCAGRAWQKPSGWCQGSLDLRGAVCCRRALDHRSERDLDADLLASSDMGDGVGSARRNQSREVSASIAI